MFFLVQQKQKACRNWTTRTTLQVLIVFRRALGIRMKVFADVMKGMREYVSYRGVPEFLKQIYDVNVL